MNSISNKFIALLLVVTVASIALNVFLLSSLKHSYVTAPKSEYNSETTLLKKENEKLKEEIESLKRKIEELNRSIKLTTKLGDNTSNAKMSSAKSPAVNETLLKELAYLKKERETLLSKLEALNLSYREIKNKYDMLVNQYQKLRDEYNKLTQKYNELATKYENLSQSFRILKSYRASAIKVRWYEKMAEKRINTSIYNKELYDWRLWYISENYSPQMKGEAANKSIARIFAAMVQRDLQYNGDLYRSMINDWLKDHPARNQVELANEIARLFYSLDHIYAIPGLDEPNAELPLFPIELLAYGLGDCEDHAMLMAALYKTAGFRVAIIVLGNHVAVQVYVGGRWVPLEASLHEYGQKDMPCGFYATITIYDLENEFKARWGGVKYYYVEV